MPNPFDQFDAPTAPVVTRIGTPRPEKPKEAPSGYYYVAPGQLEPIRGGPADKPDPVAKDPKLVEAERTASFLTTNLIGNVNILSKALKADPSVAAPTWWQKAAGLFGQDVRNTVLPAQRQVVEDSQLAILDAALTLGTGAAYTKEQLAGYAQSYFPQINDSPEALAAKRERLRVAMTAAKLKAGGAAPQIDEAMIALGLNPTPVLEGAPAVAPATDTPKGQRFTPEQDTEWKAFLQTGPSPDEINAKLKSWNYGGSNNAEEVSAAARKGRTAGVDYSTMDAAAESADRAELARQDVFTGGTGAAETLLKSSMGLNLSDEAAGVGRGLSKLLTGQNPIEGYQLGRDAERLRIADARKQLGYGGTALEVAGGFLSANPVGAVRAAVGGTRGLIADGAKAGAYGGALAGFGYGEGTEQSIGGALIGGGAGAAIGGGLSALSTLVRPNARAAEAALANRATNARVGQAAEAEGVQVSLPMIAGNRGAVNKAGILEADKSSAAIIQQGFADTADDIGTGVARLGGKGQAGDRQAQGEVFRQVGKDIMDADRAGASLAYDAARDLQPDAMVDALAMRTKIAREITRLEQLPGQNAGKIRDLKVFLKDLAEPQPLQAIRDMRTALRDDISPSNIGLSADKKASRRTLLGIIDGSKDDIERALNPDALKAWQAADKDYATNQTFYKQALKPFLGDDFDRLPAEAIFDRVKGAMNSNGRAFAALHRRLSPDQSRNFAATIADGLGKRGPDEEFSAALFMSQARKFSKSARETAFGPSGAQSFDNLLVLSRRLQAAQKEINQSKTARPVMSAVRQQTGKILTGLMMAGGGIASGGTGVGVGLAVGAAGMIGGGIRRAVTAKTLMNPRFTRWMMEAEKINSEGQLAAHINRLSTIASREPAISGEINQLQQALLTPARAVASEETENQN